MVEKHVVIKEFSLKNNCPECYSNTGLQLVFKQKHKDTQLYHSVTNEISHQLYCRTCNTQVFPIMWTTDIERVFEYHQKSIDPQKTTFKLKKKGWLLLIVIMMLILIGLLLGLYY